MLGERCWIPKGDGELIYEFLADDTSLQTHSLQEGLRVLKNLLTKKTAIRILDLGCGTGVSYDPFSNQSESIKWVGLDIVDSQEVISRPTRYLPFCAYDGVRIPLQDNSIDLGYSRQVFEHVRHPQTLLSEMYRVLKHDGVFVGSTSHLEPFHSRSYWNYTPYGFCVLLRDAGFRSITVRPGMDSLSLICRRGFSHLKLGGFFQPFFTIESPINILLELLLRTLRQPVKRRNAFKLLFSGQFCFTAQK